MSLKFIKPNHKIILSGKFLLFTLILFLVAEIFSALAINNQDEEGRFVIPRIEQIPTIAKKLNL